MADSRRWIARGLRAGFCILWVGCIALAIRTSAKARDTNPEHLLGLLALAYLAAWTPYFLLTSRSRPVACARFLLATSSFAIGLGAFELAGLLGVVDYRQVFSTPTPPWKRPGNRPDPELLYVKEGPARTTIAFRGAERSRLRGAGPGQVYRCDLQLDQNGFRNPPGLRSAEVVMIGDSFVEGLQVDRHDLITHQLSLILGTSVANLGRTSYGPQQEWHVLQRYGVGLAPRTCVWAFYEGNDLQDLNGYEAECPKVARSLGQASSVSPYERSLLRNGLGFLIRTAIHPDPGLPARLYAGLFTDAQGRDEHLYFTTGIQHGAVGPSFPRDEQTPELGRFLDVLASARALCDRHGIDLVVAFIPSKFRVYRDVCRFAPDSPCLTWPVDELGQVLGQAIRSRLPAAGFVDLTPRLKAAAQHGNLVYLADDTHWSPAGHRVAAEAIADFLNARASSTRPDHARREDRLTAGSAPRRPVD